MDLDRRDPIKFIDKALREFNSSQAAVHEYTDMFAENLFAALEEFVGGLIDAGVPGLSPPQRHSIPTGKVALQLQLLDYKIIFVPLVGTARPNARDEARVPGAKYKEECGRIAVFLSDNPARASFYDFLIWSDGSWFAWGYGWPKQADEYDQTDFKVLATELVTSFVRDVHRTWKTRDETILGDATSASTAKRVFTYGLPGDE